jgi:hypothetical protein
MGSDIGAQRFSTATKPLGQDMRPSEQFARTGQGRQSARGPGERESQTGTGRQRTSFVMKIPKKIIAKTDAIPRRSRAPIRTES